MQNIDQAVFVGQWWLPGQPDKQSAGTLEFGEAYPELKIHTVRSADSVGEDRLDTPVLHGRAAGACLTLLDVTQTGSSTNLGLQIHETRRTLFVGTVLIGNDHLNGRDDLRFNRVSLRIDNLTEWVNRTPYKWTSTDQSETVQVVELPSIIAQVAGCELVLSRQVESHFGRLTNSGFTSHEFIELRFSEQLSIEEIEDRFIRPLEQFLSLATGTECKAFQVRVGNHSESPELFSGWPIDSYMVRRRAADAKNGESTIRQHMRFGMNCPAYPPDVEFGEIIPRWFAVQAQLGGVCDLVFSLRQDSSGYLQQQIFTAASALEGMHRNLHPELEKESTEDRNRKKEILDAVGSMRPEHHDWLKAVISPAHRRSYAFRIRALLGEADHVLDAVVGDTGKWISRLRNVRDGIGHALPARDKENFEQMIAMFYSARLLAEFVLLRRLGFTAEECRRGLHHNWEFQNVQVHVRKGFPEWFSDGESASN